MTADVGPAMHEVDPGEPIPGLHDEERAIPRVLHDLHVAAQQFGTEYLAVVIGSIAEPKQPEAVDA